jgi:predicted CoA-binding protein
MGVPQDLLRSYHTIAVVGLSSDESKDSYEVAEYLQQQGYRIIPVNPAETEVLGERAYASLIEIPEPVEVVDIFRRPEHVLPIVEEAIQIGARAVWMQLGIVNEEAAARATDSGLAVVMDHCMKREHRAARRRGEI